MSIDNYQNGSYEHPAATRQKVDRRIGRRGAVAGLLSGVVLLGAFNVARQADWPAIAKAFNNDPSFTTGGSTQEAAARAMYGRYAPSDIDKGDYSGIALRVTPQGDCFLIVNSDDNRDWTGGPGLAAEANTLLHGKINAENLQIADALNEILNKYPEGMEHDELVYLTRYDVPEISEQNGHYSVELTDLGVVLSCPTNTAKIVDMGTGAITMYSSGTVMPIATPDVSSEQQANFDR